MSSPVHPADAVPVYKVGGIVLRRRHGEWEIFIVRPVPKRAGEVAPWVLPRGSRQYFENGAAIDARDAQTALAHAATLEPLRETLRREMEEEVGVPPSSLDAAVIHELGARDFVSRSKGTYPVHWFMILADKKLEQGLHAPQDALETAWATLGDIRARGDDFSIGYLPVIEEALITATRVFPR